MILCVGSVLEIFLDTSPSYFLDFLNRVKIDTVFVIYPSVGIRKCNDLSAKLHSLFSGIDSNVS